MTEKCSGAGQWTQQTQGRSTTGLRAVMCGAQSVLASGASSTSPDGARIHTSPETLACLRGHGFTVFDRRTKDSTTHWCPHSPDFNVIENMWSISKASIMRTLCHDLKCSVRAKKALWTAIRSFWDETAPQHIDTLIYSWPRRMSSLSPSTCHRNNPHLNRGVTILV